MPVPIGITAQQTGLRGRFSIGIPGCEKGFIIYVIKQFSFKIKKRKKEKER